MTSNNTAKKAPEPQDHNELHLRIDQILEEYREKENLSKTEMARLLGVPLNFYTEVLNHQRRLSQKKAKEWALIIGYDPYAMRSMLMRERITKKLGLSEDGIQQAQPVIVEMLKQLDEESMNGSHWDTNEFLHLDQQLVAYFAALPNKQEIEKVANELLIDVLIHKKPVFHSKLILEELKDVDPLNNKQRIAIQNILQQTVTEVVDAISESVLKAAKITQESAD